MSDLSRRSFLAASAALVPALSFADKPSEKIALGFIGVGMMGRGHLGAFLGNPACRVVAVSDCVDSRREAAVASVDAKYGKKGCG
ncbi:MAG: gfo/Idh/MocA family oxidoreductase, partial [Gemmataceae bacterium]|nr:gfo/Idh/MocA family oxidoreductase [Gemmataceae bacterium]